MYYVSKTFLRQVRLIAKLSHLLPLCIYFCNYLTWELHQIIFSKAHSSVNIFMYINILHYFLVLYCKFCLSAWFFRFLIFMDCNYWLPFFAYNIEVHDFHTSSPMVNYRHQYYHQLIKKYLRVSPRYLTL